MSEQEQPIEELLAQARQKEAGVKQEREDQAEKARQTAVTSQVEKLYADREQQAGLQSEIENNQRRTQLNSETIRAHRAELDRLAENKREASERLADEHTSDDARAIYEQVIQQAEIKEGLIKTKITELETESRGLWDASSDHKHEINTSTEEAQEIMGYDKNDFPKKREFVKNEDFEKVSEYVGKMRQLKAEAKEISAKYDIDKLAEKIWEKIKSGAYSNQKDRSGGGNWEYHKFEYNIDLNQYNLGSADLDRKFVANPILVQQLIDKLFKKIQETFAQSKDHEDEPIHQVHYAAHSKVYVLQPVEKGEPKKVEIWSGVGFGQKWEVYGTDASQLPRLPYGVELTDEQTQKIAAAVENPNIPIQELKMNLGFKYDPETVGRIQEDAQVENKEVDRKRELKNLDEQIDRLKKDMEKLQGTMAQIEGRLGILEKNLEYSKTETIAYQQTDEVNGMTNELDRAKRDIANLPKGLFGGVKDKEKQRSLQATIDRIERDLPDKEKAATATKEKLEQIKQDLGKDFMKDNYSARDALKSSRSLLEMYQRDLDNYKSRLDELEKRHAELEKQ